MVTRRIIGLILLLLLCVGYGISHTRMVEKRAAQPKEAIRAQALALDPTILKVISGPFKGLMADYFIMKASVFMGGARKVTSEDWEAVYTLFKQSLYLDPLFFQTGYYIQGLLSWRKGVEEKAVELLKYHAEKRYWDWEPMFYVGFDYFLYIKDASKAAEYMRQSALRPMAPPIAITLSARLAQRSGQTLTAITLLKAMIEQAEDDITRSMYAKRLEAYLGIHRLEKAIGAFKKNQGRNPETLDQLVLDGILTAIPTNPYGDHFIYEPGTGRVFFDDVR